MRLTNAFDEFSHAAMPMEAAKSHGSVAAPSLQGSLARELSANEKGSH